MKLTTRGRYSVKALLDLSLQPNFGPVNVKTIAARQSLPAPYLEKLLIELRQAGLVNSLRGAHGGYQLAKKPTQISVGEILIAVRESIEPLRIFELDDSLAEDWVTFLLWQRLHEKMLVAINSISLADLYYDARSWQASRGESANYII